MKKLTAIILTLLLCVGLLAGCGVTVVQYSPAAPSDDVQDPAQTTDPEATQSEEPEPSDEPVKANPVVEVPEGQLALGFYMVSSYDTSYSGSHAASADGNGLAQVHLFFNIPDFQVNFLCPSH